MNKTIKFHKFKLANMLLDKYIYIYVLKIWTYIEYNAPKFIYIFNIIPIKILNSFCRNQQSGNEIHLKGAA